MIWSLAEKIINYLLILAILYLTSQTLSQWNDKRNIDIIKRELKDELGERQEDLQKQIIRLDINQREWVITESSRMDVLEKIISSKSAP